MKNKMLVIGTGFALFSMFFGSGNLVFPIVVGQESGGHYLLAALGIVLTGVLVPFLGVFGMILYKGSLSEFFGCLGKRGVFLFSFISLSLMGPFGVLARCLTVAHGTLLLLIPEASLPLTSLLLCGVIYFFSFNKSKIVSMLGNVLTPFLLVAIATIVIFGLYQGSIPAVTTADSWEALSNGFFQGYQTMDLLAAFFFSHFVISQLKQQDTLDHNADRPMLGLFFRSSLIGAGLLSLVYVALVVLGWTYAPQLSVIPPQEMLGAIAMESLGVVAAPVVCLAVVFACLTTAIVLTRLFADFLRREVMQDKMKNSTAILITLSIGFLVSTFDFALIAKFLGPVLETIYPALIALTIVNVAYKMYTNYTAKLTKEG